MTINLEVEFIALRTSDLPPTDLYSRKQNIIGEDLDSLVASLIGFINEVHAKIAQLLKEFPPFPKREVIAITFTFEINDTHHFYERFKCESPRYLIHLAANGIRSGWRDGIIEWVNEHYK